MAGTLALELGRVGRKGNDVEVLTQQYKHGYFLMHSERFARGVVGVFLFKITAEKASMIREFPFTVQRRVVALILSGKASFACTVCMQGRTAVLLGSQLFALCILRLSVLLLKAFYEKGTKKYFKQGSVATIRKKTSTTISELVSEWRMNIHFVVHQKQRSRNFVIWKKTKQ